VIFYGVVSAETEKVIEFFLDREEADGFISEVEPDTAARLRIETP
jgi:hypothetical protein